MLKGRILGIFCWICLFSECFLSIRDVVWLWALLVEGCWLLLVERLWTLFVEGCWLLLVERLWAFACRKVVGFACRMEWALLVGWSGLLLVLESFLEGFGMYGE